MQFNLIEYNEFALVIPRDTNSMVEEFMLLANIATAQKTLEEFPDCACLRRHPAPPVTNYEPLIKAAETKVRGYRLYFDDGLVHNEWMNIYFTEFHTFVHNQ